MSNVGPVCHIPPKNTIGDPQPQNLPGIPGPISPPSGPDGQAAFNAAIAAMLNAFRILLMQLSNQVPNNGGQINNVVPKDKGGSKKAQWQEQSRVTETVRVFQNNDKSSDNWVDVEQINTLTMRDGVTGSTWQWKR